PPDYVNVTDATYTTLGCGGAVTLRFTDNRVVDGPGADLHVFEIGPDVEPTKVALSEDGVAWVDIGAIKGGDASLDLAGKVPAGASFAWVRLTDLETACSGAWPGADIDAVAAINAALVLTLGAAALFDYDKDALRDDAQAELDWLAAELAALPPGDVEIVGHTDHDGSREYNLDLSRRRAEAVHAALRARLPDTRHRLSATGVGEGSPIASNATEEGRARNRRVEIVARPGPPAP
ncbi:MAG: OmpA family protein, partial [Myxococcales bacterium]|nr:OmpA family protein [Myxococcales bacterium]